MAENDEQPEPGSTGMEKPAMKKLLMRAKSTPVNCALAQGDPKEGGLGLLLMHKVSPPKQVMRALKEQFPGARTPCFGTAAVDAEQDPKLVTFRMNKRIPGLDRRVRKSLKGTGFSKVAITLTSGGEE